MVAPGGGRLQAEGSAVMHLRAILIKLAYVEFTVLIVLPGLTAATLGQAAAVGLLTALLLYFIGDLLLLPAVNNLTAVTLDSMAVFLAVWLAPVYTGVRPFSWIVAFFVASALGTAEFFYHNWVQQAVLRAR